MFLKNQFLISFIFYTVFLFIISFISALIFIISSLLLALGLVCSLFSNSLCCKVRLSIYNLSCFLMLVFTTINTFLTPLSLHHMGFSILCLHFIHLLLFSNFFCDLFFGWLIILKLMLASTGLQIFQFSFSYWFLKWPTVMWKDAQYYYHQGNANQNHNMFCMCQNGYYQKQTISISKDAEEIETSAPWWWECKLVQPL